MRALLIYAAAGTICAMLLPTTGDARLDACLDAGLSPQHCRAWIASLPPD